jgi:hypothetical protein
MVFDYDINKINSDDKGPSGYLSIRLSFNSSRRIRTIKIIDGTTIDNVIHDYDSNWHALPEIKIAEIVVNKCFSQFQDGKFNLNEFDVEGLDKLLRHRWFCSLLEEQNISGKMSFDEALKAIEEHYSHCIIKS